MMKDHSGLLHKGRLVADLQALEPDVSLDIVGIRKLLNSHYSLDQKIQAVRKEVRKLALPPTPQPAPEPKPGPSTTSHPVAGAADSPEQAPPVLKVTKQAKRVKAPRFIKSVGDLETLLKYLESARDHLKSGGVVEINWE